MRWSLSSSDDGLFDVDELLLPDLGTGRMSDLEFLHVRAKKILNHVPVNSRAPSNWTINVYRGCSHACVYCLSGETPILMADGRVQPLAAVRVGDRVYGTERRGRYRRYVATEVLAHWQTVKPAFRVELEDGPSLTASADHRFLTERGWKHVAPSAHSGQRPFLTTNNELLGIGRLPTPPRHDADYRRGYLTGMIRGDANLGTYHYARPGRASADVHRFRLALADAEPLDRTREFLDRHGVATTTFAFTPATEARRAITAIRTSKRADVESIREIVAWPTHPTRSWRLGFLAGIFDSEGSHSGGALRISNSDPEILEWIAESARREAFAVRVEPARPNGVRAICVLGGLRERLRFLVGADAVTTRKRTIDDVALESDARLRVVAIEDLGLAVPMYDITTATGDFVADGVVSHNCFARPTHEYLGLNIGSDFDTKIVVKINAVEKLRAELAAPSWRGESVAMGTNTDPYQRAEAKYRLTRGILETLTEHANPFSILTKSPLVTRDLDVLTRAAAVADVSVNFSLGTVDEQVWRATEPGAPHPRRRVDAMKRLADLGIRTGALVAPILPGISDSPEQLQAVLAAIDGAGGQFLGFGALHLRGPVREHFLAWLREHDPALHADYLRRYATSDYAPKRYFEELHRRAGR